MQLTTSDPQHCDVLIIGGGGAGLRSAIAAREKGVDVLMVAKSSIGRATNTYMSKAAMASSGWGGDARELIRFLEFRNMRLISEMVCKGALERKVRLKEKRAEVHIIEVIIRMKMMLNGL